MEDISKTALELIAAERARQLTKWTPEHDAEHCYGDLAIRGAELAVHHTDGSVLDGDGCENSDTWGLVKKHGSDTVRSLTIAGALIVAELERVLTARAGE